jgi:tRNA U34 5-methylaminomethyl-2-thiouridine-forming methyltransferase MnmC
VEEIERDVIVTQDGSPSVLIRGTNITYHSKFGAVQESRHVFIDSGLMPSIGKHETIRIFEMGFGTGLNAFLTAKVAEELKQRIEYVAIEQFPLEQKVMGKIIHNDLFKSPEDTALIRSIHLAEWGKKVSINPFFELDKRQVNLIDYQLDDTFNIVYFQAFDPMYQPQLWTKEIFEKLFNSMAKKAILVTYSSKGQVRRNMQQAGFTVEKIPGPSGKREITRAYKM